MTYWIIKLVKSRFKTRFMPIGWKLSTSQNNHNVPLVSALFLYLFPLKNGIFHKFLYRTFWYSINYTYFYFPKWRYKPRMVLKITNLHILRYLPTYWLYLLERYTIDNQWCTHTASANAIICRLNRLYDFFKRWFYHTTDKEYKSIDELFKFYQRATAQDNILILNLPPNREGRMRQEDVDLLLELRKRI